ncbi:MAG: Gfo/Idh/MocA family oxidoreductase [Melioribacteraceae bacterium]|nr:Gfo/Idh/MocA family oxidoreductase [Melioribacteraceae bacterium]MCF8265448.1 Gfo/Idh/MocA family oxidoreductase [Melioribacteraceae bacterium]
MNEIRWGIIGCGDVTEVKSGPAFNRIENSKLIGVMRRNYDLAKDYAQRHRVPKYYSNADDLINDNEINAIYIATPPSSHKEYTIKSAEAGKPVYVEKPMAASYNECIEMSEYCAEKNVPLFVAYYRRELPLFKKVKELIDSGRIGEVHFVNLKLHLPPNRADFDKNNLPWRVLPEIAGAGYFYDLASHQLNFLDYYFGDIIDASGYTANFAQLYEVEDAIQACFKFKCGVIGTGSWSFVVDENMKADSVEIIGENGKIEFSSFEKEPILVKTKSGVEKIEMQWPAHVHEPLVRTVVDELLGRGKCVSKADSGVRTNWAMDKILDRL